MIPGTFRLYSRGSLSAVAVFLMAGMPGFTDAVYAQTGANDSPGIAKERKDKPELQPPLKANLDQSSSSKSKPETELSKAHSPSESRNARARALLQAGARHHGQGNLAEAERFFKQAVCVDPQSVDGFFNLGALAETRGDLVSALGHYRAGLNLAPGDQDLLSAVESMERRLHARAESTLDIERSASIDKSPEFMPLPPMFNTRAAQAPQLWVSPENHDSVDTFQLHSSMNSINAGANAISPVVYPAPPVLNVAQPEPNRKNSKNRAARSAFRALVGVGIGAALGGAGLHCPGCNILRMGF